MGRLPDTTIVNLHRASRLPIVVERLDGEAWRVPESGEPSPLGVGEPLEVGETIALSAGSVLQAGALLLKGGPAGQTHALVKEAAFRPSPSRSDVPRLILQLAQIEEQMTASLGEDPLAVRPVPETDFERAASADFARSNLVPAAARELPEEVARSHGAVSLFVNEDTAFVAMADLTVAKLRAVMEVLDRPVSPHMVEPDVLEELLERVYGLMN